MEDKYLHLTTLKKKAIPSDVKSKEVTSQFEQAKSDIFSAGDKGVYADVKMRKSFTLADLGKKPRLQCASFSFVHKSAGKVDSYLCITGWKGKFVKFRMTTEARASSHDDFLVYMGAWMVRLWPSG